MILRELDVFRKISTDHHSGSTKGGLLSLAGLILAIVMSWGIVSNYVGDRYRVTLDVRSSETPPINATLNLTILGKPCQAISVNWFDFLENVVHEVNNSGLVMSTVDMQGNPMPVQPNREAVISAARRGCNCQVSGPINIPRVKSSVSFDVRPPYLNSGVLALEDSRFILHSMVVGCPIYEQLEYYHHEEPHIDKYFESYKRDPNAILVDQSAPSGPNESVLLNVKVIPIELEGKLDHELHQHYRFTLKGGRLGMMGRTLTFMFQLSGLKMLHYHQHTSLYHLAVEVLGVLGGLFSTCALINMLIDRFV